jgi:hypothetical protein
VWRIYLGAMLIVDGVIAFTVDARHQPFPRVKTTHFPGGGTVSLVDEGFSGTAYDVVHVLGWALLATGLLLAIMGLIDYARRPAAPPPSGSSQSP